MRLLAGDQTLSHATKKTRLGSKTLEQKLLGVSCWTKHLAHGDDIPREDLQSLYGVDKYLGTKLDDALLKILERHTADLIEKYSVLPSPESIKNQESKKSPKEIIIIKREQGKEKQDSTYSIRSTDKVALEEFDLKNEDAHRYGMLHVKVKDHKRKHDGDDDEDDNDDEGPLAGSNQGRSTKKRRPDSAASGQLNLLQKMMTKITNTRDDVVNSSMPRSDTESEHSEESTDDIPMQDERHVLDLEYTDNAHISKVSTTTWFKLIPESERHATPEPEWTIPLNDFPEPENNWANT
ncbi:hypothetical protein Tco_0250781 [Tanacetum coccineum]